jgi:hypothetical protein
MPARSRMALPGLSSTEVERRFDNRVSRRSPAPQRTTPNRLSDYGGVCVSGGLRFL